MKLVKYIAAAAVALSLTACIRPIGYSEAPMASKFLGELLPEAKRAQLHEVAICSAPKAYGGATWHATIIFKDGNAYQYDLNMDFADAAHPVVLSDFKTATQRRRAENLWSAEVQGCFDDNRAYLVLPQGAELEVSVHKDIRINHPFDRGAKAVFARAAEAIELAVAEQKNYIPVESTWGGEP